jgi:predicted nucleic acid-binding protein
LICGVGLLADTSFWIALASQRDHLHSLAVVWSRHLIESRAAVLTTEAILWEWMNAMAEPATRGVAAEGYRRCHRDPQIEVVPFLGEFIESAVHLYAGRADKGWSLTDCFSFVVMEHRNVSQGLTADQHFQQAGVQAVLLQPPPG